MFLEGEQFLMDGFMKERALKDNTIYSALLEWFLSGCAQRGKVTVLFKVPQP